MTDFFKKILDHPGYFLVGLSLVLTLVWLGLLYWFLQKPLSFAPPSPPMISINKELLKETLDQLTAPSPSLPDLEDFFE